MSENLICKWIIKERQAKKKELMFTYALISPFFAAATTLLVRRRETAAAELSKATFLSQLVFKGNYDDLQ